MSVRWCCVLMMAVLRLRPPAPAAAQDGPEEPRLAAFLVDRGDTLRVEILGLPSVEEALALEGESPAGAPGGLLTVVFPGGEGLVRPLVWDDLAGCLAAEVGARDFPVRLGAVIRGNGKTLFLPERGLREFPLLGGD